jgi:tight adherence protein C
MSLIDEQTLAAVLAGIAAFAAIAGMALPDGGDARLRARLRKVAGEREALRERRLTELAAESKRRLRKIESGGIGRLALRLRRPGAGGLGDIPAKLRMAGLRGRSAEAVFLCLRMICPLGMTLLALVAIRLVGSPVEPISLAVLCLAAAGVGYVLPRLALDRLVARRQKAILRAFPDALDLLLICAQSGMSVEAALARVTKDISPQCVDLAEEFSLTMAELSYLPVRWRAYANLGERTGLTAVKLITAALVQAERHGTSIGQALTAAAKEAREARIIEAERKAATLPPKLSVPLVVFFLPVLLTIILAPALMRASGSLKQGTGTVIAQPGRQVPAPGRDERPSLSDRGDWGGSAP